MSDLITIELNDMHFFAFHGLYDIEKKNGNEFKVDLKVCYSPVDGIITDISSTIDYSALFRIINEEMQKPRELLETLAMEISHKLHAHFSQIAKAEITITKLNPPIDRFTGNAAVKYSKEW